MEWIYFNLIIHGRKTLDDVPTKLRATVEKMLRDAGYLPK